MCDTRRHRANFVETRSASTSHLRLLMHVVRPPDLNRCRLSLLPGRATTHRSRLVAE